MAVLLSICALMLISITPRVVDCSRKAIFRRNENGYLVNHVIARKQANTELECSMFCVGHGLCTSVNYKTSGFGKGLCELNSQNIKEISKANEKSNNSAEFINLKIIIKKPQESALPMTPTPMSKLSTTHIRCSSDWQKFDGHCYYISDKTASWTEAREDCRKHGGDLAVPTSSENNQHIYQAIKNRNIPTVWIGVHVVGQNFCTVGGVKISFQYWDHKEPSGGENCVELMYKPLWETHDDVGGRWNDVGCSCSNRYYICQISV